MGRYPTVENSWGRGEGLCLMAFADISYRRPYADCSAVRESRSLFISLMMSSTV